MPTLKSLLSLKLNLSTASEKSKNVKDVERVKVGAGNGIGTGTGGSMKLNNNKNYCMLTQFHSTTLATKTLVGVLKISNVLQFQSFGSAPELLQTQTNVEKGSLDLSVEFKDIVGTHAITSGLFYRHHIVLKVKKNDTVVLYKFAFLKKGSRDRCYSQIAETQTPSLKKLIYNANSLQLTKLHEVANGMENSEVGSTKTTSKLNTNCSSPTIRKSKASPNLNANTDDKLETMFQQSTMIASTTDTTATSSTKSLPSAQPSLTTIKNLGKASLEATTTHYVIELKGLSAQHYTTLTQPYYPTYNKPLNNLKRISQLLQIKKLPTPQIYHFQLIIQNKVYDFEESLLTCQPANSFSSSIKFRIQDEFKFIQVTYRLDSVGTEKDELAKCKLRIAFTNDTTVSKVLLTQLLTFKTHPLPKFTKSPPPNRSLPPSRFNFQTRTVSCPLLPTNCSATNFKPSFKSNSEANVPSTSTQPILKRKRADSTELQFHKFTCLTLSILLLILSLFLWIEIAKMENEVFGL